MPNDALLASAGEHVQQSIQVMHAQMQADLKNDLAASVKQALEETLNAYNEADPSKEAQDETSATVYSPR